MREHALLAVEHGIAIHRASLEWVRSATAALGETPPAPGRRMNIEVTFESSAGDLSVFSDLPLVTRSELIRSLRA